VVALVEVGDAVAVVVSGLGRVDPPVGAVARAKGHGRRDRHGEGASTPSKPTSRRSPARRALETETFGKRQLVTDHDD